MTADLPPGWMPQGLVFPGTSVSAAQWSATDKNASIVVSGAGLIATCSGGAGVDRAGRGTTATTTIGAGVKRFWKVVVTNLASGTGWGIGLSTSLKTFADGSYVGSDTESLGWYPNGQVVYNNAVQATGPTYVSGNTLGIACVGGGSGKLWLSVNGVFSGDPVAGTGGLTNGFVTAFPAYNLQSGDVATAIFAVNDAPSGFTAFP